MKGILKCKVQAFFLAVLLVAVVILSGCEPTDSESDKSATNEKCIRCGKIATHVITEKADNENGKTIELNYCDSCFNVYINGDDNKNYFVNPWK